MLKFTFSTLMGLVFASLATGSTAALPPKYLGISDFKLCLGAQDSHAYRSWCMPAEKPASCPAASWEQLGALAGADKVPGCPAGSSAAVPPVADK